MTDCEVFLPEEFYSLVKFNQENMPGIAVINKGLKGFHQRNVFAWHLSLMLEYEMLIDNGMPSSEERNITDPFLDKLECDLKGDPFRPNGLFLARITWNGTKELIWRIYSPIIADKYLKDIINSHSYPRPFDFRMEHDPGWKMAEWHLR
jgi:hypothetical protein